MIPTRLNTTRQTASRTSLVLGVGNGSVTRLIAAQGFEDHRLITVAFAGEEWADLPGQVFDASTPTAVNDLAILLTCEFQHALGLSSQDLHDRHLLAADAEAARRSFVPKLYSRLELQPLNFGDDILDGFQGVYHAACNRVLAGALCWDEIPRFHCPVISVGAGPSLSKWIPRIRELQDRCVIISCDATLEGLLNAGITPHFVTPYERVEAVNDAFKRDSYPGVIYAGLPVVHQDVVAKFDRHLFCPGADSLYAWMGGTMDQCVGWGQSTGTMATRLACLISDGPVYLAGHDLAYDDTASHWDDVTVTWNDDRLPDPVEGNGAPVYARHWWTVFAREIATFCGLYPGRIVNLNILDKVGAKIHGTVPGMLPDADSLPLLVMPDLSAITTGRARAREFTKRLRALPKEIRQAVNQLRTHEYVSDELAAHSMIPGPNHLMLAYILRSVYAQFSYEMMSGVPKSVGLIAMQFAIQNALSQLRPMVRQMCEGA